MTIFQFYAYDGLLEGIYIFLIFLDIHINILGKQNGIQNPNGKTLIPLATFLIYLCKQQIDHPTI